MSKRFKTIVFDFDGVIVLSNRLKYDAFFEIFPLKAVETIREVLDYHREKTRYDIIEMILEKLRGVQTKRVDFYADKYNRIVESGVASCPEMPGARNALEFLSGRFPLYINSTTPLAPLNKILRERGLARYFRKVYGAPISKIENLGKILKEEKIAGPEALVVGDGQSDLKSAMHFRCAFIGVRNEFNYFNGDNVVDTIETLPDLVLKMGSIT